MINDVQVYNSVLSQSSISKLYSEGTFGQPIYTANLIGWWPLGGNATKAGSGSLSPYLFVKGPLFVDNSLQPNCGDSQIGSVVGKPSYILLRRTPRTSTA